MSGLNLSNHIQLTYPWNIAVYQDVLTTQQRQDLLALFDFTGGDLESDWEPLDPENWFYDLVRETFTDHSFIVKLKRDQAHHTLQVPHCDYLSYYRTAQIFLQDESYYNGGTVLHNDRQGVGFELPLISNSMTMFDNHRKSWHSVVQRGYTRKSILIRWKK